MTNLFNTVGFSYISGTGLDSTYDIQESIDFHRRRLDSNIIDVDFIEAQIVDIIDSNITQDGQIFQNTFDINLIKNFGSNSESNVFVFASNLNSLSNALRIDIENLASFSNSVITNINTINAYNSLYSNLTNVQINNLNTGLNATNANLTTTNTNLNTYISTNNTKLIGLSNYTLSNVERIDDEVEATQISVGVVSTALAAAIASLTALIALGKFPPPLPSGAPPPPESIPDYDEETATTNLPPLSLQPAGNFDFVDPEGLSTIINRSKGRLGLNNRFPFACFDMRGDVVQKEGEVSFEGKTSLGFEVQTSVGANITNPNEICVNLGRNSHVKVSGEGNFDTLIADKLTLTNNAIFETEFEYKFNIDNIQQLSITSTDVVFNSNLLIELDNMFINSNLTVSDTIDTTTLNANNLNGNKLTVVNITSLESNLSVQGEAEFLDNVLITDQLDIFGTTTLNSNLNVNDSVNITSNLSVLGELKVEGDSILDFVELNNCLVSSNLTVDNELNATVIGVNNLQVKFLTASNVTTLNSNLIVNGRTFLNFDTICDNILRVNNSTYLMGNVGIGTTLPQSRLHVLGSIAENLTVSGIHMGSTVGDANRQEINLVGATEGNINFSTSNNNNKGKIRYVQASNNMSFYTNFTEKMRITNIGYVGIGTTNPQSNLHINGSQYISSNLTIDGTLYCSNIVGLSNASQYILNSNLILDNLVINSNQIINSNLTVNGTLNCDQLVFGWLRVNSNAFMSNVSISNLNLQGTITGLPTYQLSSNLTLDNLTINSNQIINSNLTVNGAIYCSNIIGLSNYVLNSNLILDTLTVNQSQTINQDLTVNGALYCSNIVGFSSNPQYVLNSNLILTSLLVNSNVSILGNLDVGGIINYINSDQILVEDKVIKMASTTTGSNNLTGAGFVIGSNSEVSMLYNNTNQSFVNNVNIEILNNKRIILGKSFGSIGSVAGTKLLLYNTNSATTSINDYSLGVGTFSDFWYNVPSSGQHSFNIGGSPKFNIISSGNVGIGTTTPESALHIQGNISTAPASPGVHIGNVPNNIQRPSIEMAGLTDALIDFTLGNGTDVRGRVSYTHANDSMSFFTNGTATLSINNTQLSLAANTSIAMPSTTTGALTFGSTTRQMINLWSTQYGIGVQGSTTYFRTGQNFAWYKGGVHSDALLSPGTGGTSLMTLNTNGDLDVAGSILGLNVPVFYEATLDYQGTLRWSAPTNHYFGFTFVATSTRVRFEYDCQAYAVTGSGTDNQDVFQCQPQLWRNNSSATKATYRGANTNPFFRFQRNGFNTQRCIALFNTVIGAQYWMYSYETYQDFNDTLSLNYHGAWITNY